MNRIGRLRRLPIPPDSGITTRGQLMKTLARVAALLLTGAISTSVVAATQTFYAASLSGPAEAPPNSSLGTGSAHVTLDFDSLTMRVVASFSGLTGLTTAAHIHCCASTPGLGTAGVATQTPSFSGFPLGVSAGTFDQTFDMSLASSYNPAFITAQGGTIGNAFAAFVGGVHGGEAYFNIHSDAFPGGEIRGFLAPIPEPSTSALLVAGLVGMFVMVRARRRPR